MSLTTSTSFKSCTLCGRDTAIEFFAIINDHQLFRCPACQVIFLDPNLPNVSDTFVEQSIDPSSEVKHWSLPNFYRSHEEKFNQYFRMRLALLLKHAKKDIGEILDVGCGYGLWLSFLEKNHQKAIGIDLSSIAISHCQSTGLNALYSTLDQFRPNHLFDIITACDVLEHVTDPHQFINQCSTLLKPAGLLYLQVPDVFNFRFPRNHDPLIPHHRWHFKYRSISLLLKQHNFEIISHSSGILGVIGHIEKFGKISFGQSLLWKIYSLLKIGNRLQVVARKKII